MRPLLSVVLLVSVFCVLAAALTHAFRPVELALPYTDRFSIDGLKGWQSLGGSWFTESGTVVNDSEERGAKLLFGADTWSDYALSADVQVLGADGDAGVIVRSTDEQLGTNAYSGYYAGLRTLDGRLVLGRADYGWLESQTAAFPGGIQVGHWYRVEVVAVGCTVSAAAVDLASGARSTVSMQGQPCVQHGRVGLRSYGTAGRWRAIAIKPANAATLAALHATQQPRETIDPYQSWLSVVTAAKLSQSFPAADASATPGTVRPIGSLRYADSTDRAPRTIRGVVILRRPMLVVQDATGGIAIPAQDPVRFAPGDEVEATGVPMVSDFSLVLEKATIKILGHGNPLPPKSVSASEAATGVYDAQYIELTGLVAKNQGDQPSRDLLIDTGSQSFRAVLPEKESGRRLLHLPRNALVQVRGIEVVDPHLTRNETPFVLFLPSFDSVELLADPPWWSLENMVWTAPILLVLLLLAQLGRVRLRHLRLHAAMQERQRLGREIHDTLAQSFAGVGYQLQAVRSSLAAGSASVSEHIDLAVDMVRHSHQEARRSIASMQAELLDGNDIACMLEERARHMVKGTPLRIAAVTKGEPRPLPPRIVDALNRVGQEAVANAIQHAGTDTLRIEVIFQDREVLLVVEDDGRGFDAAANLPGFGLLSMRKRADAIGAQLVLISRPGQGTRVELRASLRRRRRLERFLRTGEPHLL
ncbi:sensor histidine kinase [Acidipila sp. EB88]|uniref:sensor histidine kinase n=1 Tax=Acidipila sp. EB88 TaxID=2305226 RepID=UPI000F5F0AE9|nr:sensor histidine kinase [Acidipila sp. EB88]RRA49572.1 DUF1080 domain-containing protein [Acidipila sp. EB88]